MDCDNIDSYGRRLKKIGERTGDHMSDEFKPKVQGKDLHKLNLRTKKRIANRFKKDLKRRATNAEKYFRSKLFEKQIPHVFQYEILSKDQFIIADFFFRRLNLIIEIDGGYHTTEKQKIRDHFKDLHYKELNLSVIHITNEEIYDFDYQALKNSSEVYRLTDKILDITSIKRKYEPKKIKKKPLKKKNGKKIPDRKKCGKCKTKLTRRKTKGHGRKKNQKYGYEYIFLCPKCGRTYLDKNSMFYF